ncbi:MAG: hypothetical protein ACUVTW_15460, partial [Thermogutta sp.]
ARELAASEWAAPEQVGGGLEMPRLSGTGRAPTCGIWQPAGLRAADSAGDVSARRIGERWLYLRRGRGPDRRGSARKAPHLRMI